MQRRVRRDTEREEGGTGNLGCEGELEEKQKGRRREEMLGCKGELEMKQRVQRGKEW